MLSSYWWGCTNYRMAKWDLLGIDLNSFHLFKRAGLACVGCVTNERMDSSFQCCIKDDSRSISIGVQSLVLNHLKVLCLKGMVLNVQAKGFV